MNTINDKTNNIAGSFRLNYGSSTIKNVLSTAIDSLANDSKLYIGVISASGSFICLVQKFYDATYASGLAFGYFSDKLLFQTKRNGTWQTVREI